MPPLLEVDGLTVRFGEHAVVDDVSFTLDRGAASGSSASPGSGKTLTALSVIGLAPDTAQVSGSVRFDGQSCSAAGTASCRSCAASRSRWCSRTRRRRSTR